ncbi:hypothetical protein C8J56DRAFT_724818, partial [Mycena floridula]
EQVLDWLDEHPDQWHKLFSDSTEAAKQEGQIKKVSKTPKNAIHALIAQAVFTVDADSAVWDDYAANPVKYATAVNKFFIQLHKQYCEANAMIGHTGAGLEYFQV